MKRKRFFIQNQKDGVFNKVSALAYPFEIPGSKFTFFVDGDLRIDRISNVETGWFVCTRGQYENKELFNLEKMDAEIEKVLAFFGDIRTWPQEGVRFVHAKIWYRKAFWDTFHAHLEDFWGEFNMRLNVIKLDALIKPEEGESSRQAIVRQYGENAARLIEDILTKPVHGYMGTEEAFAEYINHGQF